MRDVLKICFQDEEASIKQLEEKLVVWKPDFMGKIQTALESNPANEDLIQKETSEEAIR